MKYLNDSEKLSLREFLPNELEGHEAPDHHGNNGYICPACGSGTKRGARSTGGVSYYRSRTDGSYLWKCKACGVWGDIFQYVQLSHGIDKTAAFTYVRDKYFDKLMGEEVTEEHRQEVEPATQTKPKQQVQPELKSECDPGQQPRKDYSDYTRKCAAELPDGIGVAVVDIYLAKRGFTRETIELYQLGAETLVPYHDDRHRLTYSPGVVIPFIDAETGGIPYYIIRVIKANGEERYKNPPKSEAGGVPIYHPESLYASGTCFVVEGAFDALSILQAGGEAVALNGKSNGNKLVEALRKKPTTSIVVVCFDRDGQESTEKSARELTEKLQAMGFDAICNNDICGSFKDPNEFLAADPAGFKAAVQAKIEELRAPKIGTSVSP